MTDREFGQDAVISDLRDQLAEARADVARFEAALDAANRELAEARRERDFAQEGEKNLRYLKKMWEQECGYYLGLWRAKSHECNRQRRTIRALVVAARAIWSVMINQQRSLKRDKRHRVIMTIKGMNFVNQCEAERGQAGKE